MKTRVISGIVGVIIAIIAVMNFYTVFFDIAALAVYLIAVFEICRVFKEGNSKIVSVALYLLGAVTLFNVKLGINPKLIEHPIHKDLEFCLELYWSGYAYKLCRWIEHDMDIPPEKFVHMLGNSVPEQLKPYFHLNLCT